MADAAMEKTEFLRYRLGSDALCLGERVRGGLFRPCCRVFRYGTLVGALKANFGETEPIHAAGRFVPRGPDTNRLEVLTYAPRSRARVLSKIPLSIEYVANVSAELFVLSTGFTQTWPSEFTLSMGAMKSKGFGHCHVKLLEVVAFSRPRKGRLAMRIPEEGEVENAFGIRNVLSPFYGYLFKPTSATSGVYVRSLFEGSEVVALEPILEPESRYG